MNINGILTNKKKYPLLLSPKISVIMPVYNAEKYLIYSIRSIQNQIMKEIEIILIDDCSTDNTWEVIQDLMNNEPRIRLIKNLDNRKILYSKSIGALNSKGKYILELDQDDMFLRKDLFEILYFEAENNNLDLVHFRNIQKDKFYFEKNESIIIKNSINLYTHIETQPKLKEDLFTDSDRLFLLWGLLIRTDFIKKQYIIYGL
jgi:glycosyltransferase involved in cell wall biosynthesis